MFSTGFTALLVAALFVAFVTLAGAVALVTARRLAIAFRSAERVVLLRAARALGALAVLFFRISTVVVFLSTEFLRAARLPLEVPARPIALTLLAALLPVLLRTPPAKAAVAFRDRADESAAALVTLRFAEGRAAAAPDFEPLAFAVVRVLAPVFDFLELFLRDDIRASLLPRSARQAEHATGSPDRQPGPVSDRHHLPIRHSIRGSVRSRIEQPADSESHVEKGSGIGASCKRQARR
jgi:hypothetical protein